MLQSLRRVFGAVIAFALPPRCPGCGIVVSADHSFCLDCWSRLDFLGRPGCEQCGEPLALALHEGSRCGECLADPPPFERVAAAVAYGEIARALALKLKHGQRPGVARTMGRILRRPAGDLAGALVVPVPLHRRRLWSRGYNQAALIARALVREAGGELALDVIERRRATPLLRGLGRKARARAVAGAFAVPPRARPRLEGRRVVLVDDVFTTGATARGCAHVLSRAGAAGIEIVCWARVVRDDGIER